MSDDVFGKAKYGGNKQTYFKLKDGKQTFRILPPVHDLREDGVWSVYYRVVYGYTNAAGKSRPFESCEVKSRKAPYMVEVPDASVERLNKLKARLDEAKKSGDEKAKESLFKLVGAPKSRYNLDNNHYMNVLDLQGNIGILKLRHTAKKALDKEIKDLRDKDIDPLNPENGRFFTFTRTGTGKETAFKVDVYKETINIQGVGEVQKDVVSKLTTEIAKRVKTEAAKLDKLFKKPTSSQVEQIVAESNLQTGASPNIDEILGYKKEEAAGDGDAESDDSQETTETNAATEATTQAAAATPAPTPEPKVSPIVETKVEAKAETKKTTGAPQTSAEKIADMSEADFLKSLGIS